MNKRSFIVTEEHIKLLRNANVTWEDCEFGAPAIDCKRPYGNSGVIFDIAEILGWEIDPSEGLTDSQKNLARKFHKETQQALQIILSTGMFAPGEYEQEPYNYTSWEKVEP